MIKVQRENFDVGAELATLYADRQNVGAVASFIGLVRDVAGPGELSAMTLEHYPGMTEKQLQQLEADALQRWPLDRVLIIHRYGRLLPGDQIVLCATTSAHREAAFAACTFLMDWLKTKAPFWKLEEVGGKTEWVEAKDADDEAAAKWNENR
ncbi:MAG: molybdenum cofactor biosynthesis protein MoaE [Alphaproteobacteria bacterium]|nr:molybdenum cofactor biosynthesis protein MoaE [Alphaproteobacteria bacterium]